MSEVFGFFWVGVIRKMGDGQSRVGFWVLRIFLVGVVESDGRCLKNTKSQFNHYRSVTKLKTTKTR